MDLQIATGWSGYLDIAGTWVAVVLTLFVFSFLLGDNLLYRLAEHIFVGVAVGYAAVVVFHSILVSKLFTPGLQALANGDWERLLWLLLPAALGLLLLTRSFRWTRPISWLGSFGVAALLGVGAALAIEGALFGTLLPQADAAADLTRYVSRYGWWLGLASGALVLLGTAGVLLHFHFGLGREGRLAGLRNWLLKNWGGMGRWFIFGAFGALVATTFMARLSLLVARIRFLLEAVQGLLGA